MILLSEIAHAADASVIAAKILTEVKGEHSIGEHRLRVTASIGVTTYPDNGEDAETLIKNADTAMYHAKESGRNNFQFFKRDMNLRAVERQSLEGQLRYALERGELMLHYQPKVDLKTGAITSVEALNVTHVVACNSNGASFSSECVIMVAYVSRTISATFGSRFLAASFQIQTPPKSCVRYVSHMFIPRPGTWMPTKVSSWGAAVLFVMEPSVMPR